MKIGILFNCQHESLAVALRALLPDAEIINFGVGHHILESGAVPRIAATLAGCDHVITLDLPSAWGELATAVLRQRVRRLHLLPGFRFSGFHPDTVYVSLDSTPLEGPTGPYHSRIAIAGFLAGLPPRDTADLFNRLSFARLGYFHSFAEQRALLFERYDTYHIYVRAAFARWLAAGCFMHSVNHPRMRVIVDLALILCDRMGVAPAVVLTEPELTDPLAPHPTHPVFPDIAAAIDIAPSGAYRGTFLPSRPGERPRILGTQAFVAGCLDVFQRMPRIALRQADGVAACMAALGLVEAPGKKPKPSQVSAASTVFLGYHGTVLGMETASAMLVQHGALTCDSDSTDLIVYLPSLPVTDPATAPVMGGITIAPTAVAGTISVRRGDAYLCVEPNAIAVRFYRYAAGQWESFLPLRLTDMETMRRIARGDWMSADGQRIPAPTIRMLPEFKLALGDIIVDLRLDAPPVLEETEGVAQLRITRAGETVLLTQAPDSIGASLVRLDDVPEHLRPEEVGTAEEFRLARTARLKLQGKPEILHPPLDAHDTDRIWLHEKYFDNCEPFGIGRRAYHATIVRQRDIVLMLDRSVEGVLYGRHGVAKDFGHVKHTKKIPAYITHAGGCLLLDTQALRDAPVIEGPVGVFYNGNLQNYYHWIVESMLALHVAAPYLPPATRFVLPRTLAAFRTTGITGFDHARCLPALGFGQHATLEIDAPVVRLADAIWLENDSIFTMPAEHVQSFRARAGAMRPPSGARRRLYVKRARLRKIIESEAIEAFLAPHGFETVMLEDMPFTDQIDMFTNAEFIISPHGAALANLLFCQPGTRVLELTPDFEFRPFFWLIAEKLGLRYGAMPCPTEDGQFNGDLRVDQRRFRALFRMLKATTD